jgi:AcrR family transcriptional regulator
VPQDLRSKNRSSRQQRRFVARRLEILRAAGREFRARGFQETGMRDIAEAAELSPANLYNYFHGKNDILFFCQDSSLDRMIEALEKARRMRATASGKLRMVMVSHLRCLLDEVEGSAAHLLTNALAPRQQRYLVAKRDRYEVGVRNLIATGMRTAEFVLGETALVTRVILGALNWTVQWFRPDGQMSAEQIAEAMADYLIRGLLAKADSAKHSSAKRETPRVARNPVSGVRREHMAVG